MMDQHPVQSAQQQLTIYNSLDPSSAASLNYFDTPTNHASTLTNYPDPSSNYTNYRTLQLAQAQAARLRALHSAILKGNGIDRDSSLHSTTKPVMSSINHRIGERALVLKSNQGVISTASPSMAVDRDRDYPVFEPMRERLVEAGRDSMGSNGSWESLITPEERISYILDHENKSTFPGMKAVISANQNQVKVNRRVISREKIQNAGEGGSGAAAGPVKALSEFLSEEVTARRKLQQQQQRKQRDDAQGLKMTSQGALNERHGSSSKVIKQISEIANTGKSCKPAMPRRSEIAHISLLRTPLILNDPPHLDAARPNPDMARANPDTARPNINPIKAAWLSIRGISHGGHSSSQANRSTEKKKARRSKSQTSGQDSDQESVISGTNHTMSSNHNHGLMNHEHSKKVDDRHRQHSQRSRGHSDRHQYHHHRYLYEDEMDEWNPRNAGHGMYSSSLMNGAEAEREMEAAMAMDAMEARLMEARWRRDEAIAEMEEMRVAMQEKRMAMAMAMEKERRRRSREEDSKGEQGWGPIDGGGAATKPVPRVRNP